MQTIGETEVQRLIDQLADELARAGLRQDAAFIGIRSRGAPLAERLAQRLRSRLGFALPVGSLDIAFYRDDLALRRNWPAVRGSSIPFDIDGREVVLVDDVLHTGRTAIAAVRALLDLGRPSRLRYAALIDRGGREFPIQADHVGMKAEAPSAARIQVRLMETDSLDEVALP